MGAALSYQDALGRNVISPEIDWQQSQVDSDTNDVFNGRFVESVFIIDAIFIDGHHFEVLEVCRDGNRNSML